MNKIIVAGFDPPASSNLGWSVFETYDELGRIVGKLLDAGVEKLPDDESERLLKIRDFIVDLIEKYNINAMAFEKSIGQGFAAIRAMVCENTGVIKLVGASYGVDLAAIHTSTMALQFTGFGGTKDQNGLSKKTRTKQTARDIFYPGQSFKSIASHNGNECFEHLSDAIGLCATYLLQRGIIIEGAGGTIEPKINK